MTFTINNKPVGDIGYGIMRLVTYPDEEGIAAIKTAVDNGCNYINAGEFYGPPEKNSLRLMRLFLDKYPEYADKIVLNVKGALNGQTFQPAGSKEDTTKSIENCLAQLGPVKIDQWEPARRDANVDFEKDTLATIDTYIKKGKLGGLALSELNAETIRQVAKSYSIGAMEIEFSLFHLDPLHNGLLKACADLNIPVLAYSPLGKGFLGGQIRSLDDLDKDDARRHWPQFFPENFAKNLELVAQVEKLAEKKGCTPGQIAIGWILDVSKREGMPKIIPIPGSGKPDRIRENATIIQLTKEELAEIEKILGGFEMAGDRYPSFMMDALSA